MNKIRNFFWVGVVGILSLPMVVFGDSGDFVKLKNPIKFDSFTELVNGILDIFVKIGGPIAMVFIIYSGFLFVKARGNPEEIKKAKTALGWTLVGTAIIIGAFAISAIIEGTILNLK